MLSSVFLGWLLGSFLAPPLAPRLGTHFAVWVVILGPASALFVGLGWFLYLTGRDKAERLAAASAVLAALYLITHLDGWALSTPARLASQLALACSRESMGLPAVGVLLGWVAVGQSWLCYSAVRQALSSIGIDKLAPQSFAYRALWVVFPGLVLAIHLWFWQRALLGYASGSPDLFSF